MFIAGRDESHCVRVAFRLVPTSPLSRSLRPSLRRRAGVAVACAAAMLDRYGDPSVREHPGPAGRRLRSRRRLGRLRGFRRRLRGIRAASGGSGGGSSQAPVVLYSSDGMRPDLMQRYASQGAMPTYADLMRTGATGDNGLTQGFPPNTGQGWYTMATGAWPGVHGSTNNTFFDNRQPFTSSTSFSFHGNGASPGTDPTNVLEAQSVASSAELAGKKVAQIEWTGGLNANINGPTVDYATFYSQRGTLNYPADATKQAASAKFGLSYQVASFAPASGWTNVPPRMDFRRAADGPHRHLDVGVDEPQPHLRPVRLRQPRPRLRQGADDAVICGQERLEGGDT